MAGGPRPHACVAALVTLVGCLLVLTSIAAAQRSVTSDGTLGTSVTRDGRDYTVRGGTRSGDNLFHSFDRFGVPRRGSVTFVGPSSTANVIGRVTGGERSMIEGLLSTRASMPNANFFLINPHGVMFTEGARLDVGASFHVATSNSLVHGDGRIFSATPVPGETANLSAEPPSAFGFSGTAPAPIVVDGATLRLATPSQRGRAGHTLSLVAGDIDVRDLATVSAPGGRVQIGSVASPGTAELRPVDLGLASFHALGDVTIRDRATVEAPGGTSMPSGAVVVRSGTLVLDGERTAINVTTFGPAGPALGIDLRTAVSVTIRNGGAVRADSLSGAAGSSISIHTPALSVENATVTARAVLNGRSGAIDVDVGRAEIVNGIIQTFSARNRAGDIAIAATEAVGLAGTSEISTGTNFGDRGGDIAVRARDVVLEDSAIISSGSFFLEGGGRVSVTGRDSIVISGAAGIANRSGTRDTGDIGISARRLSMDAGFIDASSFTSGNAGSITMNVGTFSLTSGARISSASRGVAFGSAGRIEVRADRFTLLGADTGIFSNAEGVGAGGHIDVRAHEVSISGGARVSARSSGTGAAGNIDVTAGTLRMDHGLITTEAAGAQGGNISIGTTGSLLHLTDSRITTSVQGGTGDSGNINIGSTTRPFDAVTLNDSQIRADAHGGAGGNVDVFADVFLTSGSIVSASSALGVPGTIDVQASITDVSGSIVQLPESVLQAAALLRASCAARLAGGKTSSLVVAGREGVPPEPGGLLPSSFVAGSLVDRAGRHHRFTPDREGFLAGFQTRLAHDCPR